MKIRNLKRKTRKTEVQEGEEKAQRRQENWKKNPPFRRQKLNQKVGGRRKIRQSQKTRRQKQG